MGLIHPRIANILSVHMMLYENIEFKVPDSGKKKGESIVCNSM